MAEITPDEARGYLERFELLEEVQTAELRRASMEIKLRQLSALMSSRNAFGADPNRECELQVVRERWARLRQILGG